MVRKVGANTPGISPPELYDITGDMRQRIAQDTQQASSAAMQAFGNLAQAQAANSARMLQNAETAERARFMQSQAEAENAKGGGVLGGIGQLMTGFVGAIAAKEEVDARRQALEMEQMEKARKADLEERQFQLGVAKHEYEVASGERKFQLERDKEQLDQLGVYIDSSLAEAEAQIESAFVGATHEQGITFAEKMFDQIRTQYSGLFEQYPALEARFNMGQAKIRQNIVQRYADVYRDEIEAERKLQVNVMNQKANLTLATRFQELGYAAGTWTPEQANAQVNSLIAEGLSLAQQDPAFQAAVSQNPGLMLRYYDNLLSTIGTHMSEYAKKNAEITATVTAIREANAVFSAVGDTTDPATVAQLQEFLASKGLPQWNDPNSWATSIISTANNRKKLMDSMESTQTAAQLDPMFGLDSAGHRAVANVNKAELLYNALNLRDGWDIGNATAYAKTQAEAAKKRGDYTSEAYWDSVYGHMSEYQETSKNYGGMKDELRKLDKEFADMTRPQQDTTVLPDVGSATRVPVTGVQLQPRASQAEIDALNKKRLELRGQITEMRQVWLGRGIDLDNVKDDAPLKQLKNGAAPYLDQLNQSLMQRGAVPDTGDRTYQVRPGEQRQSLAPPGTVNFTGGRVPTETVVQGQTGTLPLPPNAAPQTPSVPLRGGLATAPGLGMTPFKAGKVSFTGGERGQLTISSSDPRVASPIGGKVMYAGGTNTLGKTIVIRTADGLTEVYSNVNTLNVKRGDNVAPGMVIGTASRLGFQVWQNEDSIRALRMESPRNMIDPIKYLNGTVATVQLPRGTGVLDATTAPPTIVAGGGTNMFASDKYTVFGDLLWDKTTGKTRQLTPKERSYFYPQGMNQANQGVRDRNNAQAQAQAMGLTAFGGASDLVSFGKTLQTRGWTVWQHPEFGGVSGGHAKNSYHYRDLAVDVHTGGKSGLNMQQLADEVVANGNAMGVAEVIHNGRMWKPETGWQKYTGKNQHKGHVHIAFFNAKFKANFVQPTPPNPGLPQTKQYAAQGTGNRTLNFNGMSRKQMFDTVVQAAANAGDPHPLAVALQWAWESGWGKAQSGKNNYFGIKSGKPGVGSLVWTWEERNGRRVKVQDWFVDYNSIEEGIAARVKFTQGNRYREEYNKARTPREAIQALKNAGYATDSKYVRQLMGVLKEMGYDPDTPFYNKVSTPKPPTRDQVSNRPARVARAAGQASVYPGNKPGANYGYKALANNPWATQQIYKVANELGVPAQWVADITAHGTKGRFDKMYNADQLAAAKKAKTVDEFTAKFGLTVEEFGIYAGRAYTPVYNRRPAPMRFSAGEGAFSRTTERIDRLGATVRGNQPAINTTEQLGRTRFTPVQQTQTPGLVNRHTVVQPTATPGLADRVRQGATNAINQVGDAWQRILTPRYHTSPRSNCPTCQQMQRNGNFRPHAH